MFNLSVCDYHHYFSLFIYLFLFFASGIPGYVIWQLNESSNTPFLKGTGGGFDYTCAFQNELFDIRASPDKQ